MPPAKKSEQDRDMTPAMPGGVMPTEGPAMPGGAVAEDAEPKTADELREEADAAGVLPTEGSGAGGRVVKADLEAALENAPPAGRPPLIRLAEQSAAQTMNTTREEA